MEEFKIKLRNNKKDLILTKLNTDSIKVKFRIKGLYKEIKFKSEVSVKIFIKHNNIKIKDLSICDIDLFDSKSSSDYMFSNPYNLNFNELTIDNDGNIKKIYNHIKDFINSIKITKNQNLISSLAFNSENSKIKKMNIKGYVRNYKK